MSSSTLRFRGSNINVLRRPIELGDWTSILLHTGQHFDEEMSAAFFRDLGLRHPDINLGVGSGSHATQTAAILVGIEPVLEEIKPDLVVVVGDVNSTMASALAAAKLKVPVAHVEAGLRSGDRGMPEEINRIVTDQLATLCLTPSRDADENLKREGVAGDRIHFVGNVMIDTLHASIERIDARSVLSRHRVEPGGYGLVTLHRPANVDDRSTLREIIFSLDQIAEELPLIFPVHPRTRRRLEAVTWHNLRIVEPVPYLEMMALLGGARVIFTDSGGLQEESTALGVPCFTLRTTTERPITMSEGTNVLVPDRSRQGILQAYQQRDLSQATRRTPEGWDGNAAERIAEVLDHWFHGGHGSGR